MLPCEICASWCADVSIAALLQNVFSGNPAAVGGEVAAVFASVFSGLSPTGATSAQGLAGLAPTLNDNR